MSSKRALLYCFVVVGCCGCVGVCVAKIMVYYCSVFGQFKVVPCVGDEKLPDGVIVTATHRLPRTALKLYELCAKGGVDFQASLHEAKLYCILCMWYCRIWFGKCLQEQT